jgi:hypothetical protein
MSISYEKYDENYLLVTGDQKKFDELLRSIGGKRIDTDDTEGWVIRNDKEPRIQKLIDAVGKVSKLDNIKSSTKVIKGQRKYRRDVSDDDDNMEEDETDEKDEKDEKDELIGGVEETTSPAYQPNDKVSINVVIPKVESDNESDPIDYYKTFGKKPSEFNEMHASSPATKYSSSASDSYDSSSSDDFPAPESPKKRGKYRVRDEQDVDGLFDRVRDMQRRLYEIEIKTKHLSRKHK